MVEGYGSQRLDGLLMFTQEAIRLQYYSIDFNANYSFFYQLQQNLLIKEEQLFSLEK